MTFYSGQKVVHIGWRYPTWREWWEELRHPIPHPHPIVGEVYTVLRVTPAEEGGCWLLLLELPEPVDEWWGEGWASEGFRPAVERKTSIEALEKIARKVGSKRIRELIRVVRAPDE